jgi:hypothetical protein
MDHLQRGWDEQLRDVHARLLKSADTSAVTSKNISEDTQVVTKELEGSPIVELHRIPHKPVVVEPVLPQSSPSPQDNIEIIGGRLNIKTAAGDASIPLSKEAEALLIRNAMKYQEAIISEKKTNALVTIAMAILTGLSALAIGLTLFKGSTGNRTVSII